MGISLHKAPGRSRNCMMLYVVTIEVSQCLFSEISVKRRVTDASMCVYSQRLYLEILHGFRKDDTGEKSRAQTILQKVESRDKNQWGKSAG